MSHLIGYTIKCNKIKRSTGRFKMAKAKYQIEDFLMTVNDDFRDFVITVHEMLLQEGYKLKVQSTKSYGLHITYSEPKIKTVKGIIVYFLVRDGKLMIRINADNLEKYSHSLNCLPEKMVSQIEKADDCIKMKDPQRCWQGCMGYDFQIGEKHFQKCLINCFLLDVDAESMTYILDLVKSESKERLQ